MSGDTPAVRFLYGTAPGRALLQLILRSGADRIAVCFLHAPLSRPMIGWYARKHGIPRTEARGFRSFGAFFVRERGAVPVDLEPTHLISPCDGYLSAFPIGCDSSFQIKGSRYRLSDLLQDEALSARYDGGTCLIFRLCAADYHHYCYIDDGDQGTNHFIPGQLHSVQPAACAAYPVYTLNRRVWTLLATEHFGPVVQTAIGALIVGGIHNDREDAAFQKGEEMGHFELAGSTIVLLFEQNRIALLPEITAQLRDGAECRVKQGMWIGTAP